MADALLTQISIPPNVSTVTLIASLTLSSERTSQTSGRATPPASSISWAAVNIVPGNLGCGSAVLAAMAIFAPSAAAFLAIAKPIPLLPPVINSTLSFKFILSPSMSMLTSII